MRTIVLGVRTLVLSIPFLLITLITSAQSVSLFSGKVEIGAGLGPLFFLGDLGGNVGKGTYFVKDINPDVTKFIKGLYVNVYPAEWFGFRISASQGQLEGADSLINDKGGYETARKVRNLHFRSRMMEAFAALELYPTVFFERYEGLQGKFRPYGLIGAGILKFNPQTQYYSPNGDAKWVNLQPLKTEGQGMAEYPDRPEYKLTTLIIPMGVGFKYYIKDNMYFGFEVLHRKTFSDYVDDVSIDYIDPVLFDQYLTPDQSAIANQIYFRGYSNLSRPSIGEQRGNKNNNDSYFSSSVRMGWRLNTESTPSQLRCPKF